MKKKLLLKVLLMLFYNIYLNFQMNFRLPQSSHFCNHLLGSVNWGEMGVTFHYCSGNEGVRQEGSQGEISMSHFENS